MMTNPLIRSYRKPNILTVREGQCRYIEGEVKVFCADPVRLGTSWCEHHYQLVYTRGSIECVERFKAEIARKNIKPSPAQVIEIIAGEYQKEIVDRIGG